LETFEQNIEKNGSEKKELLERKIGGKKSKIGAALLITITCNKKYLLIVTYYPQNKVM